MDGSVIATVQRSRARLWIRALAPTNRANPATSATANTFNLRGKNPAGSLESVIMSPFDAPGPGEPDPGALVSFYLLRNGTVYESRTRHQRCVARRRLPCAPGRKRTRCTAGFEDRSWC